ncbi:MAG: uracil-DNA glycosylase [Ramlibacter sp.]|nr:uracil-DNA glycosylase [Ramlibacter sp.]
MSLAIDERQRAMLAEMGIRTWAAPQDPVDPSRAPAAAPLARPQAPEPLVPSVSSPVPVPVMAPAAAPVRLARPEGVGAMDWASLRTAVAGCQACRLCESRRNTVFGTGDEQADWLIVGEAPGENEDLRGEPFVGQAGKLLDNMLKALSLTRHDKVFIANVLKCRPPGNRNPDPAEVAQCQPFLQRQVELLQPRIIVAMGRFAVQSLLQTTEPIGRLRGRAHQYGGVPLVVTYHPAYLLRNLPDKAKAWADLCLAKELLGDA